MARTMLGNVIWSKLVFNSLLPYIQYDNRRPWWYCYKRIGMWYIWGIIWFCSTYKQFVLPEWKHLVELALREGGPTGRIAKYIPDVQTMKRISSRTDWVTDSIFMAFLCGKQGIIVYLVRHLQLYYHKITCKSVINFRFFFN